MKIVFEISTLEGESEVETKSSTLEGESEVDTVGLNL